jgi:hypothetical protein
MHGLVVLLVLITGLCAVPSEALAQGCAMCRTAVQSPDDPLVRGINFSVAIMLVMPFAVIGSIGGWLIFTYRRAHRLAAAGGAFAGPALEKGTISGSTEDTP